MDLRVFRTKGDDDIREVVGPEAFAGKNADEALFAPLEVANDLLGLLLHIENLFRNPVEHLPGIGQGQLPAEQVDELDFIEVLQSLQTLGYGRLSNEEGIGGGADAAVFDSKVKDLQQVDIHCI